MPKKRRLKTTNDIRRFLAYIVLRMDGDEIPLEKGTKLSYVCNILLHAIENTEMEQRLRMLEETINQNLID